MEFVLIIGCLALLVVAVDSAMNMSKVKNTKEQRAYRERFTLSAGALAIIIVCFLFQVLVTSYRQADSQGKFAGVGGFTKIFSSDSNEGETSAGVQSAGTYRQDSVDNKKSTAVAEVKQADPLDEDQELQRYGRAFAETLRITPEDFQRRFNDIADKRGYDKSLHIDNPQTMRGNIHYKFGDGVEMILTIDKITQAVKDISVTVTNLDVENNIGVIYPLAIGAANSKLTDAEISDIINQLQLDNLSNEAAVVVDGFRYAHALVEGGVVNFTIAVDKQ